MCIQIDLAVLLPINEIKVKSLEVNFTKHVWNFVNFI